MYQPAPADSHNSRLYLEVHLPTEGATRLLKLKSTPTDGKQQLSCDVFAVNLEDEPEYFALSYAWKSSLNKFASGIIDETHEIRCNGHKFTVFDSLYQALLRLTTPPFTADSVFWIDKLCINQADDAEKSRQVAMMGQIYAGARQTIIWLGIADVHSETASGLVRMLGSVTREKREEMRIAMFNQARQTAPFSQTFGYDRSDWLSLMQFFQRAWFSRGWVVQECVLAQELLVMCGDTTFTWAEIFGASNFVAFSGWKHIYKKLLTDAKKAGQDIAPFLSIENLEFSSHENVAKMNATLKDFKEGSLRSLLHLLVRVREFDCLDFRDKVYSMCSIARSQGLPTPRPDYSLSSSRVYMQAAVLIIERNDLHLLAHVEGKRCLGEDLPSWVPDWSCTMKLGLAITGYERYCAAGDLVQRPRISNDGRVLTLNAACIESVAISGESKKDVQPSMPFPGWMKIILAIGGTYFNGQDIFEALWRTLIRDTDERRNCPADGQYFDLHRSFQSWLRASALNKWSQCDDSSTAKAPTSLLDSLCYLHAKVFPGLETDLQSLGDADTRAGDFLRETLELSSGSMDTFDLAYHYRVHLRLFSTVQGYIGLGCEELEVGDSIWIVPGSRVPLIMRRKRTTADQTSQYELVGGTYLHGFMKGEALQSDLKWETISVV